MSPEDNCAAQKYDSATEALYGRALESLERVNGRDHPDVANILNNLAALHQVRGEYRQAEAHSQRSVSNPRRHLRNKRALLAELNPDTVTALKQIQQQSLTHLATAMRSQARYSEAEPLYRRALAIAEDTFGPEHPRGGLKPQQSRVCCINTGEGIDEAEPLYQRARSIVEEAWERITSSSRLSSIISPASAMPGAAMPRPSRSPGGRSRICEQALGPKHPEVAVKLSALAAILDGQGKYKEAESLYRRALGIYQEAFGPDHPDVALNLNNLAAIEEAGAIPRRRRRSICNPCRSAKRSWPPDHPQVATSLNNLAMLYRSLERYRDAEPCFKRALAILRKHCGADHPNTVACLANYAALLPHVGHESEVSALEAQARGE